MAFEELIENTLERVPSGLFAGIIGENPSAGARSPHLWNAAFHAHELTGVQMYPLDVAAENLTALLAALEAVENFIGGAVAVPYKESVASWLNGRVAGAAGAIGAVNCLYRGKDGRLSGTNTDGEAALKSIEKNAGTIAGKNVVLLGLGGAGKAVAAYVASALGPEGGLTGSVRDAGKSQKFADNIGAVVSAWPPSKEALATVDVVINCTSVGSTAQDPHISPLPLEAMASLGSNTLVFDIIYDPAPTMLLKHAQQRSLQVLDGKEMNLMQAILAFEYAAPQPFGADRTREAMATAAAELG